MADLIEMYSHLNDISSTDVHKYFDKLVEKSRCGASVDELLPDVWALSKFSPFWTIRNSSSVRLFRAVKSKHNKYYQHVSELSYPPAAFIKTLGRANRENVSVLYVAQDGRTAMFESRLTNGQHVAVTEFGLQGGKSLNLQHVGTYGVPSQPLAELARVPKGMRERFGLDDVGIANVETFHRLLGEEFMREVLPGCEAEYALSVAITECLLAYPDCDGILFPSKRSPNDYNIALKTESADNKLFVKQVLGLEVIDATQQEVIFRHWATSKSIDVTGRIEWHSGPVLPTPDWASGGFPSLKELQKIR